jgi:hypothetical protein
MREGKSEKRQVFLHTFEIIQADRAGLTDTNQSTTSTESTFWKPRGSLCPRRPRSPR